MSKSILLTDTHIGIKNSNRYFLDLTLNLFKEIIDYCLENNINRIIHLGDWFNNRYSINVLSMQCSIKIIELLEKNNIDIIIIKGNHDQYYKNKSFPHSLILFNTHKNVTIVEKELELENEVICGWGCIPKKTNKKILLGHYEINNFIINNNGSVFKHGKLKISDFKKFDKVYSGHFHTKSIQENIEYIGSAFPMDFNDAGDKRGYYEYENGKLLKFIEFKQASKFIIFDNTKNIDELEIKNNFCKLIFTENLTSVLQNELITKVLAKNPKDLKIVFNIPEDEIQENEDISCLSNKDLLDKFIDISELSKGLKKPTLLKILKKIQEEET